ncbi:glycoside hydrolase [Paenibacillus ferrarius]|uniref:Glycoside hydrolase n=1 Tax=Paenibacillus ferrarius TaxID=1469647 RepID=A0A1V4HIN1_9BACL|nr:beta-galactosidase [Paenibacillus ferrarius]OPH56357.1 glycoside hydrolase [Paenibacillus ferrarius]
MSQTVIIFHEAGFPISSFCDVQKERLEAQGAKVVGADCLGEALRKAEGGCFVNLHAPYFPKSAWPDILAFLQRGGGLLSVGGAAFKRPVRREGSGWLVESEQTAYHQQLYIHEILRVEGSPIRSYTALDTIPLLQEQESLFALADTWNMVPHTTRNSDLPHQMGAAGTMSTQIYPLLKSIGKEGREIAAPVVLWENTRGEFIGSRWMFVNVPLSPSFWSEEGAQTLLAWASFCASGVTELWIKPNYASFEQGEHAMLTIQSQLLGQGAASKTWTLDLRVEHEKGEQAGWNHQMTVQVNKEFNVVRIPVPLDIQRGLYRVTCKAASEDGELRVLRQGFWGHDHQLLAEGQPIACGRDYFIKDGHPLPVVGMTYMTSDVARKFLFLPNADVWDRDMAQMAKAGINWIRTGIWTAYRNIMQVDGHASEEVLRAIDAFFLTAKKHNLQVTFTFFSFTPETWEGVNPYLDPQSVEAQKRFIRSIVSRHRATTHVDWDLINEPSMFDPAQIFSDGPRSSRDVYEREAFVEWLKQRHKHIELLQERWNMSPEQLPTFEAAAIPEAAEINFDVQDMHRAKKGTRWLDYCLFSMEMHNRWAKELYDTIKEICPDHLVVVGQDEALGAQRPSPFFYEEAVDYTTVHSWWLNDNLVWDGIFAKTAHKPNVIQETGIMYVETPDGRAKRSEIELRSLLERKYAYAFSTGGAGAIHWIWNTNFYMDNANESHIGALRADGTEKPEADVSYEFGRFMAEIKDLFQDRALEDIVAIFPYSNDFSNRKLAFDATTRMTRVLAYQMKMPFRGASEYHLDVLEEQPAKLILLPSAHNLDEQAWNQLVDIVKRTGATLLATGPISLDAYWKQTPRLTEELGSAELHNVRREERLQLQGAALPVSYGQRRIAEIAKEVRAGNAESSTGDAVVDIPLGKGRLIWSPLPVELNERTDTLVELYQHAIESAGVASGLQWMQGGDIAGVYGRKLSFKDGFLYVFVSEFAWDVTIEVKDTDTEATYTFTLEKERSVLFAADAGGHLISVYRPNEVHIERS